MVELENRLQELHAETQQEPDLPVRADIAEWLARSDLADAAAASMQRILDSVNAELTPAAAPWAIDRARFARTTAANAFNGFNDAFDRWRQLYSGARSQLVEANRRSEMHGLTAQERREAKSQQAQANEQITLLEKGNTSGGSDFYSYRYLATEGFLPGYNFPRLPLYAYVPASGFQGSKAAFLQRARFLAIAEFGPLSLIYHEGRAYRVFRARLPAGLRTPDGKLATANLYVCDASGAAHDKEPERCHVCGESSWVEQEAEIRGLSGWVRNRRDGSVEAVFSGETTVVDAMTEACRSGPRMAVVENVKVVNTSTDRDLRGFRTIATV